MTEPRTSYARRFVRSAWLLLTFQAIAALLTIGVTGWAAFYVADLRAERDELRAQLAEFTGAPPPGEAEILPPVDEAMIEDDAVIEELPGETPELALTPAPGEPAVARRPAATTTGTTRRPPSRTATQAADAPTESADTQAPARRPNRTYPGGLPGRTSNSEPPVYPGRLPNRDPAPSAQSGVPTINLDGLSHSPDVQQTPNTNVQNNPNNY